MRKIAITIAGIAISMLSFAQIKNIPVSPDSSVKVDVYAGTLGGTMFSTDSIYANKFVNVRFGAAAIWQMNKYIAFKALGVFHAKLDTQYCATHFYLKCTPSKLFTIQIGQMPTLSTEQRPNPATGDGHFETFSESQIPGSAPGVKLNFNPDTNWSVGLGTAVRKNEAEYHANIKFKKFVMSGYYSMYDEKAGAAASYCGKRVFDTFVWKQDQIVSNILVVTLVPKIALKVYADTGYNLKTNKLVRGETGLLKNFESKYIKGLWGLGYQYETNTVNGYLFIHL